MFRYSYTAIVKVDVLDSDNNIISQSDETFVCDYQPNVNNTSIDLAGSSTPISYQLYVPKTCNLVFGIGKDIICNDSKGSVALVVPYRFGRIIYVKG
jgi:hypothetical protein